MAFFRSYVAPFLIVVVFLIALVAVSARIVLPNDMMAPAPTEDLQSAAPQPDLAESALPPQISVLLHGQANPV
ncbi:MAG: hypothetical protein ACTS3T_07390 [Almyronema sp.]